MYLEKGVSNLEEPEDDKQRKNKKISGYERSN